MNELKSAHGKYLETQVKTATREQLLLMLYDGAIRFAEQAKEQLLQQQLDTERYNTCLLKSQRIVTELTSSLDFNQNDEIARNLARLYGFIYNQLVQANMKKENTYIDNSIRILKSLREAWQDAIAKLKNTSLPESDSIPSEKKEHTPLSIQA